jgi:hypothetical protein
MDSIKQRLETAADEGERLAARGQLPEFQPQRPKRPWPMPAMAAAILVVVLVVGGVIFAQGRGPNSKDVNLATQSATSSATVLSVRSVSLPDGTQLEAGLPSALSAYEVADWSVSFTTIATPSARLTATVIPTSAGEWEAALPGPVSGSEPIGSAQLITVDLSTGPVRYLLTSGDGTIAFVLVEGFGVQLQADLIASLGSAMQLTGTRTAPLLTLDPAVAETEQNSVTLRSDDSTRDLVVTKASCDPAEPGPRPGMAQLCFPESGVLATLYGIDADSNLSGLTIR